MRESLILWLLYRTVLGRMILKLLVQLKVSKVVGYYLSSRASRWIVPYYIRKHKIDMSDIKVPSEGFTSFNEFFTRKRETECFDMTYGHLISPCDGFLSFVRITGDTVLDIKSTKYTMDDLLKDHELAGQFREGSALIFRLTPANYHRYCYVANGKIILHRKIQGMLHCVRPIAIRTVPVFAQNSREYQVLGTEHFGTVVQMEIGSLLVGKIRNDVSALKFGYVQRSREKGYFEFGGSTIIILLQKNTICLNENLYKKQRSGGEIPVRMGEYVARAEKER
ncbi:MAG: phosphatidylserine decarboxylase [Acetatifactor sp.]|nr:phosphatidylserine decarboxylase [Acetatifactor sp.]